jgi:hypothetical protein
MQRVKSRQFIAIVIKNCAILELWLTATLLLYIYIYTRILILKIQDTFAHEILHFSLVFLLVLI